MSVGSQADLKTVSLCITQESNPTVGLLYFPSGLCHRRLKQIILLGLGDRGACM